MYDNLPAAARWRATNCAPMPRCKVARAFCRASELESVNLDLSPFPPSPGCVGRARNREIAAARRLIIAYNYLGSVNPVVIMKKK